MGDAEIIPIILILLVAARAGGEIVHRFGHAPSVGELLAGVILAGLAGWAGFGSEDVRSLIETPVLGALTDAGIFFLVLTAGSEMKASEIRARFGSSVWVALGGMVVPFAGAFLLTAAFLPETENAILIAFVIGVASAISAVPATVKVLNEFRLLHAPVGETVVTAALFDDVMSLVLLALLTAFIETGEIPRAVDLAVLFAEVIAFFVIAVTVARLTYPRLARLVRGMESSAFELSVLIAMALLLGILAERLDLHWIVGVFVAGLLFEPAAVGHRAYRQVRSSTDLMTSGLFGPMFFVLIGFQVDLAAFGAAPLYVGLLIVVAFAGKLLGAGLPARLAGLDTRQSVAVGIGMGARGAVELVFVSIAAAAGLFEPQPSDDMLVSHLFSALILMAIVTTILTPIFLRATLRRRR